MQLRHLCELFTLGNLNVLEALRNVAIVVQERGVIFQHSAHHFEVVDAPGEGVRECFEDEE